MREHRIDSSLPEERRAGVLAWPLAIFCTLALIFAFALRSGDPSRLPSALLGRRVPAVELAALEALADGMGPIDGFRGADLAAGQVSIVNFWAS
jgi:cytochrome c biogenesis protein CcmG/thiol:disulfide interchange protein DsbE